MAQLKRLNCLDLAADHALRHPTVTCPGCKRPMSPSPPLAVSDDTDLCDLTYTCKKCGAATTRTIKIEK